MHATRPSSTHDPRVDVAPPTPPPRRTPRWLKWFALGVVLAAGVAAFALTPGQGHKAAPRAAVVQTVSGPGWSLHPHPRVTVALAPGESPPIDAVPPDIQNISSVPSHVNYQNGPDPSNFRRPSDAEVQAELKQLHKLGLGGANGYVNPFAHVQNLVPERIDMGIDYSGTGPVVALGSGVVFNTDGAGWPGGAFIGIVLDSGPYARRPYFIAEDVKPVVKVGQHVQAGQVIGVMYNGGSGIETGWAAGHGDVPLAAALNQQSPGDPGGWTSAAGFSFDKVLVAVGAPSGIPQAGGVHGQMPPGYP